MKHLFLVILLSILCYNNIAAQTFYASRIKDEITINKTYIVIGYNKTHLIPNYVGEKLVYDMTVGEERREPGFYPETDLPEQYQTRSKLYTNSGYDRGHLAPAADFKRDRKAMYDSFTMANVAPQWPSVNRGKWQQLEDSVRLYSKYVDTLYVITGTIIQEPIKKLQNTNITIPMYFYKAILGKSGRYYKVSCAWIVNNSMSKVSKRITINELEKIVGRNLFYKKNNETVEDKILLPEI